MQKFNLDVIPKNTYYCYGRDEEGKRKVCPYWHREEGGAYCEFLNSHSEEYDISNLIWDKVKECNVSSGYEDE